MNRPRNILINRKQPQYFKPNKISTCKYTLLTFFPRFLFEKFYQYPNFFFLTSVILQQIPDVSPTGRLTTAVPLAFILFVSAIKEIIEDIGRRKMDNEVNAYSCVVVRKRKGTLKTKKWRDLKVGEIVKLTSGQVIPADLVLLSTSEQLGIAYIETSSLDGETNLKIRQALVSTDEIKSLPDLHGMNAEISCEAPSKAVNEFVGALRKDNEDFALGITQFLPRGARIKNTKWAYGVTVYTGHDTRLLQNSTAVPFKVSRMDTLTNRRILILFIIMILISVFCAVAAAIYNADYLASAFYLDTPNGFIFNMLSFYLLLNYLIPISLQVTLEVVRFFQARFINKDIQMYDEENDVRCHVRTSNLNDELGQVKFIMTDKTGTLTKNVMKFKQCTVDGVVYGDDDSDEFCDGRLLEDMVSDRANSGKIEELLTMMSICHTVVPERTTEADGELIYQATSPDEGALVRAARSQGFLFKSRTPSQIVIETETGDRAFQLLDILDFSSDRKRMSIIVRDEHGRLKLFCKGADNVIVERLRQDLQNSQEVEELKQRLEEFSMKGYRTLVFASKIVNPQFYMEWSARIKAASVALENRGQRIAEVAEEIERDLVIVGATAIEDKLQDEVPLTIQRLLEAKIRIWMLTGDKRETAINIAQSSAIVKPGMKLLILDGNTYEIVLAQLRQATNMAEADKKNNEQTDKMTPNLDFALVISGESLTHAIIAEARPLFLELILRCQSVVCCRLSPMQKAEVVSMVKKHTKTTVLAIGDGANDVAMIQTASVGVGITGREGLQAASASDYSIGQFKLLRQLLLVHGVWSVERNSRLILFSFYKNICMCLLQLWFAFFSSFSSQPLFNRWTITLFNILLTALPPGAIGLFDQPVPQKTIHKYPFLYATFHELAFSDHRFLLWVGTAIYHSLIVYFSAYFIFYYNEVIWENGRVGGWVMLGNTGTSSLIVVIAAKSLLECDVWNVVIVASALSSILFWLITWLVYSLLFPLVDVGASMRGSFWLSMSSPTFLLSLLLIPVATLLGDLTFHAMSTSICPSPREALHHRLRQMKLEGVKEGRDFEARYSRKTDETVCVTATNP